MSNATSSDVGHLASGCWCRLGRTVKFVHRQSQGATVYVSGSANKMPQDVMTAFEDAMVAEGGLSRDQAKRYLRGMELGGRYHVEAWS